MLTTSGVYTPDGAAGTPAPGNAAVFRNGTEEVSFSVRKAWDDRNDQSLHRPERITVRLTGKARGVTVVEHSHTFGSGDGWSYTFPNVPKYDYSDPAHSEPIDYAITEDAVAGYASAIRQTGTAGGGALTTVAYEITNTLRTFSVSKRTPGGGRLAGATLELYMVENGTSTLFDRWTTAADADHLVTGLAPGSYRLVEAVVPAGYVRAEDITITVGEDGSVTSGAMNAAGTVVMIDPAIPRANVSGTKTWIDLSNQSGARPENISLTLYADNVPVSATPTWVKNGDQWTYIYANLLVYRTGNTGPRIVYRVEEAPVAGYTTVYDGLDITNQLTGVEIEYTSVSGVKTWADDDDAAGRRPDAITVVLLRNGSAYRTRTVTEADGWAYAFQNLPTSDGLTAAYTYTISERSVPGYVRAVRGHDLVNTYMPPEEPPATPKSKSPYTPEEWEALITLLDEEIPLYGGLIKTERKPRSIRSCLAASDLPPSRRCFWPTAASAGQRASKRITGG